MAFELGRAVNWSMRLGLAVAACALLATRAAVAGEGEAPIEVSAGVGGGVPLGALEAGSSLRDVSFAVAPVEVAFSYLDGRWGATAWGTYAPSIPTLCGSSSECIASVGRDITAGLSVRYDAPRRWKVQTTVSAGLGYEWFTSKLSDGGATSSRSFHGVVIPAVDLYGGLSAGHRWRLGPFLGLSAGRFTGGTLQSPGGDQAALATEPRWHGWAVLGFRMTVRP
jgi:hypothetical protein